MLHPSPKPQQKCCCLLAMSLSPFLFFIFTENRPNTLAASQQSAPWALFYVCAGELFYLGHALCCKPGPFDFIFYFFTQGQKDITPCTDNTQHTFQSEQTLEPGNTRNRASLISAVFWGSLGVDGLPWVTGTMRHSAPATAVGSVA